jgi:Family of unknown function (DUF6152)
MSTQRVSGLLFALAVIALTGGVAAAHHSQPGFNPNDKPIELKGVVAEYRWRNPHVLFFWDVKDEHGKTVRWVGEFASIPTSLARGITKDTFKVGDQVTITGRRATAGTPVMQLIKIVKADGTEINGNAD